MCRAVVGRYVRPSIKPCGAVVIDATRFCAELLTNDIDHSSSAIAIAKSPFKKMWLCRNLILARTLIGGDSTAE